MTIHLDEDKIADATEQRLFDLGVVAATDAVAKLIGDTLAKYGITVTDD